MQVLKKIVYLLNDKKTAQNLNINILIDLYKLLNTKCQKSYSIDHF